MKLKTRVFKQLFAIVLVTGLSHSYSVAQGLRDHNIVDYGAISDGNTLNTEVIQRVIDMTNENGGGRVIVPEGKFLTGTIEMKSNVELHLKNEAILLGSTNPLHYKSLEMKGRPESPKKDDNSQLALLVAYKTENLKITGKGTIDGQGRALALNIDSLHHAGIVIDPDYGEETNRPNEKMRPKLLRFSSSNNVSLLNTTFKNAACWGLSFELCNGLVLDSLTIYNRAYWNNDGVDITDSKNVRISNCDINSADDAICLKSYYPGYFNDSIDIYNCDLISGASAIKFGTASYGGFKNVTVRNINISDTYRSAIAIESVDGGIIENIKMTKIIAKNTGNAIFIRLGHRAGAKPGIIRNIHLSNIKVEVPFSHADVNYDLQAKERPFHSSPIPSSITGIPGHNVEHAIIEMSTLPSLEGLQKGKHIFH